MKKRALSLLLVLVMVLGMFPMGAMATGPVTVGFTAVDCLNGKIEYMRKELTVTPGLAKEYLDGEYGGSIGMTTEVGANDVTPIDVLVAAHIDEYGDAFTDSTAETYITGFDYVSRMFGTDSEITWTANGIQPHNSGLGYAINQYIVQEGDEIAFYRMSWYSYPANLYASFDKTEAQVKAGENLTLKLGLCSTMGYVDAPAPAGGAEICVLNEDGTIGAKITETDENGNATVSFDAAGTYYLTCKGEVGYLADMDWDGIPESEDMGTLSPAYCKVTVTEVEAAVESVVLNKSEITLTVGHAPIALTATVLPDNAANKAVTWTTSDPAVATVDGGKVTAIAAGTATITAKAGHMTAACAVTVKNSDTINTVTFKVPEGITPVFYGSTGYDENRQDILSTRLNAVAGAAMGGWTAYTVSVPDNFRRVSFRGTADETSWGGMSVAVKDYEDKIITEPFVLRQLEGIINTKIDNVAPTPEQAAFKVKYGEGAYAVTGGSFHDQYGNLGYRFLLLAADNSLIYTYYAQPLGDLANTYAEAQGDTKTVTGEAAAKATAVMKLANKSSFKITAPENAKVQMFRQSGYFNVTEYTAYSTERNNDGTKTVTFNANNGMWRVSMDGKITKAGYCEGDSVTVTWEDGEPGPHHRADYDLSTNLGNRGNDSMYVNVNYRNNLRLDVDETFRLRSYRIWEIINTDTANVMIEPDFHYNVISGSDVIEIAAPNVCSGNATNNWLDIKGLKAGTAVVEITYDAIHLMTNPNAILSTGGNFIYNAVDPARTALIVVQVGAGKNDVDFGIRNNAGNVWDAEHDTLCFTGDSALLKFRPTAASGAICKVEVSGDKGASWTELAADNGEYTANILHGNNIIRVTKADGSVSHQLVRGYKLTVVVTEVQGKSDMDGTIEAGETVSLWLKGYHNPVGKMSGIYNSQTVTLHFMVDGTKVSRGCGAYGFYGDAKIHVMIPGTAQNGDTITLEDGYATNSGFGSGGGAHRNVGGEVPPNLDADTVGGGYNIYDDITVTVGASTVTETVEATGISLNTASASVEKGKAITLTATVSPANATEKTVTWTSSDPAVVTVSASGKVTGVSEGTAVITATIGAYSDTCTVTVTASAGGNTPGGNPELEFGLNKSEILGYVTVSFEDKGIRRSEELSQMDARFRTPLGTIIPATRVPFKAYDTIASVTLRLLTEKGFAADHEGNEYSSFYLAAIGNFTHLGTHYASFGEFDAGRDSGWMITWDDWFINKGASEFMVKDGDVVRWQYTCQLGADIGDNGWMNNGGTTGTENQNTDLTKNEVQMTFTDVQDTDFFCEAVKWALEKGITNGTSATAFSPNASCTRAQMVTFLWRAAGSPKAANAACSFTDVSKDAYYYEALLWAVENGITNGTSHTTFSPDAVCSRGQMAAFLHRNAQTPAVSGSHAFADVKADAYYNDAVIWAAARGITNGTSHTTFSPDADCTRAQMVTFLYRYLAK